MAWIVKNRLQPYTPTRTEPYLTDAIKAEMTERYFPRYPTKRAVMLPLFRKVMHEYGFIAPQVIDEAAAFLGLAPSEVQDAVTFYEEFRFEKTGKHVINLCRSVSCELCGYEAVRDKIQQVFGIDPGDTTDDDKITLFEVECLGACEQAPCALVNEDLAGNLTPEAFVEQLKQLPAEAAHHGNGQPH